MILDAKNTSQTATIGAEHAYQTIAALIDNIEEVVLGKRDVAQLCVVALLAGEHVLLEDVPGVGKTLMGSACAVGRGKFSSNPVHAGSSAQ